MKALTLWQPWATLIALGVKTIETRPWATNYRGPIAIHAAKKPPAGSEYNPYERPRVGEWIIDRRAEAWSEGPVWAIERHRPDRGPGHIDHYDLPLGAVVATATLVDCLPMVPDPDTHDHDAPYVACCVGGRLLHQADDRHGYWIDEQRPYGHYAPGRFAWMLADITPVDPPIEARGRQRLWNWEGTVAG